MIVDMVRKNGESIGEYVFIVADVTGRSHALLRSPTQRRSPRTTAMRVLVAARGQMQCADIRAAALMARGGTA